MKNILLGLFVIISIYGIVPSMIYKAFNYFKFMVKKDKKIYLTFDDGPSKEYTLELLDLLKEYNVKATFFLVASFCESNREIIQRMKEDGHTIGLHFNKHTSSLFLSPKKTKEEFENGISTLNELGVRVKYFRPPWGQLNLTTLKLIKDYNLKLVLWNIMAQDWQKHTSCEVIKRKLLKRSKNGGVVCLHDGRGRVKKAPQRTIHALSEAIPTLLSQGYSFGEIS